MIILDARRRSCVVTQMRRGTRTVEVHLEQAAGQLGHARDHCRTGDSERHLPVITLSERRAGSESYKKQRQRHSNRGTENFFCVRLVIVLFLSFLEVCWTRYSFE